MNFRRGALPESPLVGNLPEVHLATRGLNSKRQDEFAEHAKPPAPLPASRPRAGLQDITPGLWSISRSKTWF